MKHSQHHEDGLRSALDRGEAALAGGLLDDALECVTEALRLDPDHAEARLLEARVRLRRHEPKLALTALDNRDLSHSDPKSKDRPDVMMLRATALANSGRVELASKLMEHLARDFAYDTCVLRALAGLQIREGRRADAAHTLGKLLAIEPEDRASARLRADLLADGDPSAALDALGEVDHQNRHRAATLAWRAGRLAEAEDHYAVLTRQPESMDEQLWLEAGRVAESMGENQLAQERYNRSGTIEAMMALGRVHLHAGRTERAGRSFWRATRIDAQNPRAWAGLVMCASQTDRKGLVSRADQVLRSLTTRQERRLLLARLYPHTESGPRPLHEQQAEIASPLQRMLVDASAVMAKTADKFPGRADVHYHRAVCNAGLGEHEQAVDSLDQAIQINPKYAAALAMRKRLVPAGMDETQPLFNGWDAQPQEDPQD